MDTIAQVEIVIRSAAADSLFADVLPRLYRTGWEVIVNAEDGIRSLLASKGTGRIYLPGGRAGRWHAQVTEVEVVDAAPDDRRGLLPEFTERIVWRADLDQCTPVDLILTVAERAAHGPGGVLVA